MNELVFLAIDGNEIGKRIDNFIITGDMDSLTSFSTKLALFVEVTRNIIDSCNGKVFMAGGDNVLAQVPFNSLEKILCETKKVMPTNLTFSVGVGNSSRDAYLAIKVAKASNYLCVVCDNDGVMLRMYDDILK